MKKILILLTLCAVCLAFASCKDDTPANSQQPSAAPKHTVAPTDVIHNELEWAPVDCDITLNTKDSQPVLINDDFDTFALVGNTDEDSHIVIKLTDDAASALKTMTELSDMPLLINNVEVAKITIDKNTFNGEITFGEKDTISQLQEYANIMRALY